jgi:hypothetical protein
MTLEEFNSWFDRLSSEPVSKSNRDEMGKFGRFSPEKFAKANNLDEELFIKEVNGYKKIIHNKLLCANRIDKLKKYKPNLRPIRYGNETFQPRQCVCVKFFFSSGKYSKFRFYETINYHYIVMQDTIIVFNERKGSVHMTDSEFDDHFDDIRNVLIDKILNNN